MPRAPGPLGTGPADLTATVLGLVAAREQALGSGEEELLARVHAPGGATWAADLALVRAGPVDVSYEVLRVRPVPGRPQAAAVGLRTTVAGATTTEDVVLELVGSADGWRVGAVGS